MKREESEPIKLIILEREELYKYLYLSLPLGEQISLLDICSGFRIEQIRNEITGYRPEVLLISSDKLDSPLVDMLSQVREEFPSLGVAILLFSYGSQDGETVRNIALKGTGGIAVFLRQSLLKIEQLVDIIKAARCGHFIFDPILASQLFSPNPIKSYLEKLTGREMETLSLVAKGYSNSSIAETMFIDVKTVEHHLNSLYGKLKTENDFENKHPRVEAARLYFQVVKSM